MRFMRRGAGGDFGDRAGGRIVDIKRRLTELRRGLDQFAPIVAGKEPAAEFVGVDVALRAEHALGQFEPGHFQAHEQRGDVAGNGHVFGDVRGQGGFAHAGPGGQDDQFRIVQAAGQIVQVVEPGGYAHAFAALEPGVDAVEGLDQQVLDVRYLIDGALVVYGEDFLLGLADDFIGLGRCIISVAEDFGPGVDQVAERGFFADDLGVINGIGGVGDGLGHLGQVCRPADGLEIARLLELLDQEHGVDPLACAVHGQQVAIEFLVGVGVKILGMQDQCDLVAQIAVQKQAADDRFFGVQILRRQPVEDLGSQSAGGVRGVSA